MAFDVGQQCLVWQIWWRWWMGILKTGLWTDHSIPIPEVGGDWGTVTVTDNTYFSPPAPIREVLASTRHGYIQWHAHGGSWFGDQMSVSVDGLQHGMWVIDSQGLYNVREKDRYPQSEYPTEIAELYEAIIAQQLEKEDGPTNT
jgi:hypothetical protein